MIPGEAIIIFVVGLCIGTLLNFIIVRFPREKAFGGWPRCTRCGQRLRFWQILPVVGWLAQSGRAGCCGQRLNPIYPIVECLYGVMLVVLYLRYGLTFGFYYLAFVAAVLVVTGAIDWLHRYIYTLLVFVPTILALLASFFVPQLSFANALVGALAAGLLFALLFFLARVLFPGKAAPFGLGDVYLAIFIGAAIGFTNLMPALFYGILLAGIFSFLLIILRRSGRSNIPEYISYGTFLCLGTLGYMAVVGM